MYEILVNSGRTWTIVVPFWKCFYFKNITSPFWKYHLIGLSHPDLPLSRHRSLPHSAFGKRWRCGNDVIPQEVFDILLNNSWIRPLAGLEHISIICVCLLNTDDMRFSFLLWESVWIKINKKHFVSTQMSLLQAR